MAENYKHLYEQTKKMLVMYQDEIVPGFRKKIEDMEKNMAEVVHGRWEDHMVRDWRCSECGKKVPRQVHFDGYCYDDKLNYCPNCGAKMDGEREDE